MQDSHKKYTPKELADRKRQRIELSKVQPHKDIEFEPEINDNTLSQDDKDYIASYLLDKYGR